MSSAQAELNASRTAGTVPGRLCPRFAMSVPACWDSSAPRPIAVSRAPGMTTSTMPMDALIIPDATRCSRSNVNPSQPARDLFYLRQDRDFGRGHTIRPQVR
ncbi:hypothetical protein GCM10010359_42370 [Streptomyces morookaense]|nr:hypothetical protein GCM10010359_42370 [Streptomyces morookaense]